MLELYADLSEQGLLDATEKGDVASIDVFLQAGAPIDASEPKGSKYFRLQSRKFHYFHR